MALGIRTVLPEPLDMMIRRGIGSRPATVTQPQTPITTEQTQTDSVPDENGVPRFADGLIDFAKALAPTFAGAGIGALAGGGEGALIGAQAGASFQQGKVKQENLLAKQEAEQAATAQENQISAYDAMTKRIQAETQRDKAQGKGVAEPKYFQSGNIVLELKPDGSQVRHVVGDAGKILPDGTIINNGTVPNLADEETNKTQLKTMLQQDMFAEAAPIARALGQNALADALEKKARVVAPEKGELPAGQRKLKSDLETINFVGRELIDAIEIPEINENIGLYAGALASAEGRLTGGEALPVEFITFDSFLNNLIDKTLRMRSGAAVPPQEAANFKMNIIGGTTTSPKALKARLEAFVKFNEIELANIEGGGDKIGRLYAFMPARELIKLAKNGDEAAVQMVRARGLLNAVK